MRLWHEALIPYLPRQQLCGQHRECCALRGLGWGKKHSVVDYVFTHPYGWLVAYHRQVILEMARRGYNPDMEWLACAYRGKSCPRLKSPEESFKQIEEMAGRDSLVRLGRVPYIYPEHNAAYLQECLDNLAGKGIYIDMEGERE